MSHTTKQDASTDPDTANRSSDDKDGELILC